MLLERVLSTLATGANELSIVYDLSTSRLLGELGVKQVTRVLALAMGAGALIGASPVKRIPRPPHIQCTVLASTAAIPCERCWLCLRRR